MRIWVATGVIIASAVIFISFVQNVPEGRQWTDYWKLQLKTIKFKHTLQKDPPLGKHLSSLPQIHPINGINLPDVRKPLLIIVLRGCEECPGSLVRAWAELMAASTWRRVCGVVLLIQDEEIKVKKSLIKNKWEIPIIADTKNEFSKALNAFFTPRAYGFEKGKLVWIQKEPNLSALEVLRSFLEVLIGEKEVERLMDAYSHELREKTWGKNAAIRFVE